MYASLLRRYQGLVWDGLLYLGALVVALFLPSILNLGLTGTRFTWGAFLAFLLLYDPLLVGLRGGTVGHFRYHIRVLDATSAEPIGLPRALLRGLVKALLGFFSLIFMLVTARAQSLHDLVARSIVVPADATRASALDIITPVQLSDIGMPSRLRRSLVILAYSLLALFGTGFASVALQSPECLNSNVCTAVDRLVADVLGFAWLLLVATFLVLGWRARLFGCRRRDARPVVVG